MTVDEIAAAYPGAAGAVRLTEHPLLEKTWALARGRRVAPSRLVVVFKNMAALTTSIIPGGEVGAALPQMDHPDFLRYVRAKLGAV
jgi:hypothetical protein